MNTHKDNTSNEDTDLIATETTNGDKKTPSFVPKRNILLLRFFKRAFPKNDIRIMGDENSPAVVFDHEFILSCYVHNFELRFTSKNFKGDILFKVSLNDDFDKVNKQQIEDWHLKSQHRKINRIYLESEHTQAPLYLVGWNFRNKTKKEGKYPVFGEYEPKVYFRKEKAVEVQTELVQMGYNVIVI